MNPYHVKVAAEAFAAGIFAQAECDVLVQYGADQPSYDLVISKRERLLKISVKGSQDGGWALTQSYLKQANYQHAVEEWLNRHDPKIVFCFVQFEGVQLGGCPRLYLARPFEISKVLCSVHNGRGDTVLYENHTYSRGSAKGTIDAIPENWRFSAARLDEMFEVEAFKPL
jgi:hypothetical protein